MNDKFVKVRRKLNINGAVVYAAFLAWLFSIIYHVTDKARLIVVMNAFVFGAIISLVITYAQYIYYAIASDDQWNRARQFGISTAILWASVLVVVAASVIRHSGSAYDISSTNFLDYLFRYLVIIAATMQVFAPDYGERLFYSKERQSLILGSVAGICVAIFLIVMQAENFLDW